MGNLLSSTPLVRLFARSACKSTCCYNDNSVSVRVCNTCGSHYRLPINELSNMISKDSKE